MKILTPLNQRHNTKILGQLKLQKKDIQTCPQQINEIIKICKQPSSAIKITQIQIKKMFYSLASEIKKYSKLFIDRQKKDQQLKQNINLLKKTFSNQINLKTTSISQKLQQFKKLHQTQLTKTKQQLLTQLNEKIKKLQNDKIQHQKQIKQIKKDHSQIIPLSQNQIQIRRASSNNFNSYNYYAQKQQITDQYKSQRPKQTTFHAKNLVILSKWSTQMIFNNLTISGKSVSGHFTNLTDFNKDFSKWIPIFLNIKIKTLNSISFVINKVQSQKQILPSISDGVYIGTFDSKYMSTQPQTILKKGQSTFQRFKQGNLVQMCFNISTQTIQWRVDGKTKKKINNTELNNKNLQWVPVALIFGSSSITICQINYTNG